MIKLSIPCCISKFIQFLPVLAILITGCGNTASSGHADLLPDEAREEDTSLFSYNEAIGKGGNPAQSGTPGGGSGGAIYNDGNTMTLVILDSVIEHNTVNAYGAGVFFVSNDHTGNVIIKNSIIRNNTGGSWYPQYTGISAHSDTPISVTDSIIE